MKFRKMCKYCKKPFLLETNAVSITSQKAKFCSDTCMLKFGTEGHRYFKGKPAVVFSKKELKKYNKLMKKIGVAPVESLEANMKPEHFKKD